jgi:methionine-rich copper-binding protein CopC
VVVGSARRLAVLLGLSAVWLLLSSAPALAHARLLETYPADGATVAKPPEQVQLRFNEAVEAAFDPIEVYDGGGNRVDKGDAKTASENPKVLIVDLEDLSEGSYTVDWHVTSADGHTVGNAFGFAVDASAPATDEDAEQPIEPIERSADQEQTSSAGDYVRPAVLGLFLVCALAIAGFVVLRRGR